MSKKPFIDFGEPETRFEEKQKEKITEQWLKCVEFFTEWLNKQDLINAYGHIALATGEVKNENNIKDYVETTFREEIRENFYNYSNFCSYAFLVWTLVKAELKDVSPEERTKFTKKVRNLRTMSEAYDEIINIFDQLNEYVGRYMPIKQVPLDRELRL